MPQRYQEVELDAFVAMPNHIHGIIMIDGPVGAIHESPGTNQDVGAIHELPGSKTANHTGAIHELPGSKTANHTGAIHELPLRDRRKMTLPKVVGYLKMNSAKRINQTRDNPGAPVWQRNYYERIIRDDRELDGIRRYIAENPARWEEDENHPARITPAS